MIDLNGRTKKLNRRERRKLQRAMILAVSWDHRKPGPVEVSFMRKNVTVRMSELEARMLHNCLKEFIQQWS